MSISTSLSPSSAGVNFPFNIATPEGPVAESSVAVASKAAEAPVVVEKTESAVEKAAVRTDSKADKILAHFFHQQKSFAAGQSRGDLYAGGRDACQPSLLPIEKSWDDLHELSNGEAKISFLVLRQQPKILTRESKKAGYFIMMYLRA